MSRIDIVVPCYNYGRYLRECVESILDQPVSLHVLIIDDASTDGSDHVGRELAVQDQRVEFRHHPVNKGHIATYNEGLEWATGDYVLLISADDALVPGALARALRVLDAEPGVGLVCGREIRFQSSGPKPLPRATDDNCAWKIIKGPEFIEACCSSALNPVPTPTAVIRTSLLSQVGFYRADLPYTADMAMWLTYAAYSDIAILDSHQAYYRIHMENLSIELAKENPLIDIRQRKKAFEALFEDAGHRLPNVEVLRNNACKVLGMNGLHNASVAFSQGNLDYCREALNVAVACWPQLVYEKAYRQFQLKLRVGPTAWRILRGQPLRGGFSRGQCDQAEQIALRLQLDDLRTFEKVVADLRRSR